MRDLLTVRSTVLAAACSLLCGCPSTTPTAEEAVETPTGLSITITSPKPSETAFPVHGTIEVTGSVKLLSGAKLTKVSANIGDTLGTCTLSGLNFTCQVDTTGVATNGKTKFKCNQGASVSIVAEGTYKTVAGSESAAVNVEVDNCLPVVEIFAPADGGTFVGETQIVARVRDAKLTSAEMTITDENGESLVNPDAPYVLPLVEGLPVSDWKIRAKLDTSQLDSTRKITIAVKAADAVGNEITQEINVISIKRPVFLGNTADTDEFVVDQAEGPQSVLYPVHGIVRDVAFASTANAPDGFVQFTSDPTPVAPDNLADVVMGTDDGVYIRAGLPRTDMLGRPVDKSGNPLGGDEGTTYLHSLHFENVFPDSPFAPYRVLKGPTKTSIRKVFLVDVDVDGDLDIVAVGSQGTNGVVWAALNVPATVKRKDTANPEDTLTINGFKLAQVVVLPALVSTAAMGDLDQDGQPDLVIASSTPGVGLMTLRMVATPECTVTQEVDKKKNDVQTVCGSDAEVPVTWASVKSAKIFETAVDVAVHKGVSGITTIAIDDFWKDSENLPDVCVGESARPLISCYRNRLKTGVLDQATLGYDFGDGGDTFRIMNLEYTATGATKDGPDLLVASKGGDWIRWIKGNHAGKFTFVEDATSPAFQLRGLVPTSLAVAKVGPKGEQYVIEAGRDREVTIFPTSTKDGEVSRACFRAWVGGSKVSMAGALDFDGDGVLDLWALDEGRPGVSVLLAQTDAKGLFADDFIGPDVHHLCGYREEGGYGVLALEFSALGDFAKDKKAELVLAAKEANQSWTMGVFQNVSGRVAPEPRQGRFAPTGDAAAGNQQEKPGYGLGNITAGRLTDLTGDGVPDLVVTRGGTGYTIGKSVKSEQGCNCWALADNEVDNWYGDDGPNGTDVTPNDPSCCANYFEDDKEKKTPLHGYGDGAPIGRASVFVFTSDSTGPLKIPEKCPAPAPCKVQPAYAFAGGREPIDVHVVDVNADQKPDLVTAMDSFGQACVPKDTPVERVNYAAPRMRIFENKGAGKFTKTFISGATRDMIKVTLCGKDETIPVASQVNYRILPGAPAMLRSGPWPNATTPGTMDSATLFALGQQYGMAAVFGHTDKFQFLPSYTRILGPAVKAFGVRDVNGDGLSDILALLEKDITYLFGVKEADGKSATFPTKDTIVETAQKATWLDLGDVNGDGIQDIVLLEPDTSSVRVYLGTGRQPGEIGAAFQLYDGAFVGAGGAIDTTLADMDGDGCTDVVIRSVYGSTVLHNESGGCKGALLSAHLNK